MKIRRLFLFFLCFVLLLGGCRAKAGDARGRLDAILSRVENLPAGRLYDSHAQAWEEGAPGPMILQNLYRNQDGESAFLQSESWALFLATGMAGGEAAVFVTGDGDARVRIGEICRERLALLRLSFGEGQGYVLFEGDAVILFYLPAQGG